MKSDVAIITISFSAGPASVKKYVRKLLSFLSDRFADRILLVTDNHGKVKRYFGDKYNTVEISTKLPKIKYMDNLRIMVLFFKMCKYIDKCQNIKSIFIPEIVGANFLPYVPLLTIKNKKVTITLHGVAPLILEPDKMFRKNIFKRIIAFIYYLLNKLIGRHLLKNVGAIITVSHSEKRNICKVLNVPPERIKVVYHGVSYSDSSISQDEAKDISSKYRTSSKYFFHLSAYQPKKNVETIIQAFIIGKKRCKIEEKLIIGGKQPKYLERLVMEHYMTNEIEFCGYIPKAELTQLYRSATAFVFPSFHESFGMPLLEAMIHKCPVITSNIFSMPEIVEKGGIFVDPSNVGEIVDAMAKISESPKLRKKLGELGFRRAKRFTWKKTSKETFKIILKGVSKWDS